MNSLQFLHGRLVMNRRVDVLGDRLANLLPDDRALKGLDVGCGSGEIAQTLMALRPEVNLEGVDVFVRPKTAIPVTKFDGLTLPFADNSFDFVLLVDVLHHADDPKRLFAECDRVARRWLVIKDHRCDSLFDRLCLRFMDWVGNRAYGVALPYNYLSSQQWQQLYREVGVKVETRLERLNLYPPPAGWLFDRRLHFCDRIQVSASNAR